MRIGLIGYGAGGRYFHAPLIASLQGATFAGVVTRSPERRAELAKDHPGVPAYDSLEKMAKAGVDAVVLCVPPSARRALFAKALKLRLPMLCDKPFAFDATEAQAYVFAAEDANVSLTVYQNRRWDSDVLTVRRVIEQGLIGDVRRMESRMEVFTPDAVSGSTGGGILRDFGSHMVDQALQLFGAVERVYAELDTVSGKQDHEEGFFVALHHASGVVSHLLGSHVQSTPGPRFRITGSKGSFTIEGMDGQQALLLSGRTPATEGERWGAQEHSCWGSLEFGEDREKISSERGRWDLFYQQWLRSLRGEGEVPVDPHDAIVTMAVLDAARISAREGRVVNL